MKSGFTSVTVLAGSFASLATAHVEISYPGWRGNNIITNETFPFGMQWMYPCGGLNVTQNRTHWPLEGGAIAVQPGYNSGHQSALMYVNIGLGEVPSNFTTVVVPMFHLTGPTNEAYDGTVCLPHVPLPRSVEPKEGDLATIQVVQAARHGGALFSASLSRVSSRMPDGLLIAGDESKIAPVNESNCFNSSGLSIQAASIAINENSITDPSPTVVSTPSPTNAAIRMVAPVSGLIAVLLLLV
ncbi:hypothetical protein GCG54_00008310 [Colletotrichum gloeosporioides]|uniref:Copper acquisition factor BIM1-like domain-containing protein n=1 Tax=Colletotrichum gloeosporioides TaxID=474922 RepID=A0A8H4C7Z1_COLGL|nr:uncharacterized protein GCG54_00008310 [Colletotrichum gloeosporioides]KAF3798852.1 hypothetical protein GCG54_00008310 [Colletotrichum gloeosporioides]